MEILSWNCRGINNDSTIQALKRLIIKHRPSIVFLCETKIHDRDFHNSLCSHLGFNKSEVMLSLGQSGGLALFWSDDLDVRFRSKSHHHIDVVIDTNNPSSPSWRFTGFYGHPTKSERYRSWALLRDLADVNSLPWAVVGDFNELLHAYEKIGGRRRCESQMQGFRDALTYSELFDHGYIGSFHTWKDSRTKSRLDRVVVTPSWSDIFSEARVSHLPPSRSDHIPLLLGVHVVPPLIRRFSRRFRFESFWLQDGGCYDIVLNSWLKDFQGQPMFQVSQKIMSSRLELDRWQKITFGARSKEIDQTRLRLQEVFEAPITAASSLESVQLHLKLDGLLQQDYDYWKQRAKILWLSDGDRNTKYFHQKASNRRKKNTIKGLFDSHGVWHDSENGIENVVLQYFDNMFKAGPSHTDHLTEVVNLIEPGVTPAMNDDLCAPYSAEEIRLALFQMHPTKSPGPDGMPQFFQHFWETVGESVVLAVQNFLESGQLVKEINFTHVCLIPKVKNPENMSQLRPIALCNVIYKLCAKVLANRLKKFLPQLISPFQSAFVPGRLITDNTLIANEISHFIHHKRSGPDGYMALKLDMSKAYDRIEWGFLQAVLTRLGFVDHWINIIMQCVTTVRYSFLINGRPCGYMTPSRGLRQGDPLSPFLFLLCTEGFSALLMQKANLGLLQGIRVCPSAPAIHHLLFADDSLLFANASIHDCYHIKQVLHKFELAYGQKVNYNKSSIVFSKNVHSTFQTSVAESLSMEVVSVHEKYLGLPTFVGRSKIDTFAYIKERLRKKLEGWQGKMLSGAGKEILVRVCAQALPNYAMNCFLLPKTFCDELHQLFAKFWWGSTPDKRKIHWLSWEALCRSKEEGGMGFRDLYLFNLALLAKQAWRLISHPQSLLAQIYKARYFSDGDFWTASLTTYPSYSWRSILASRELLMAGSRWQVGSGHSIRIWEDRWLPHLPLFRPSEHPSTSAYPLRVNELKCSDNSWNVPLIQSTFDPIDAVAILQIPVSMRSLPDRLIWHYNSKGLFTVCSAYKVAYNTKHSPLYASSDPFRVLWKKIWSASVPGKVKIHIWRACRDVLPTAAKLLSRFVYVEQGCLCCSALFESIVHIGRDCPFTIALLSSSPDLLQVVSSSCRLAYPSFDTWLLHCSEELNAASFGVLLFFIMVSVEREELSLMA